MDKEFWILLAIIVVAVVVAFTMAYKLFGISKIKSWLLWAVTQAEKEFGGGTGKLKLAYVYDMFIAKFPKLQAIVPFTVFSALVDEALVLMREMLKNDKIQAFVEKGSE